MVGKGYKEGYVTKDEYANTYVPTKTLKMRWRVKREPKLIVFIWLLKLVSMKDEIMRYKLSLISTGFPFYASRPLLSRTTQSATYNTSILVYYNINIGHTKRVKLDLVLAALSLDIFFSTTVKYLHPNDPSSFLTTQ